MGFFDSITNVAKDAAQIARDAAEIASYTSFGVPLVIAQWIQSQRIALGLPQMTDPVGLIIVAFIIAALFATFIAIIYGVISTIFGIFIGGLQGKALPIYQVVIFCIIAGFLVSLVLYYMFVRQLLNASGLNVVKSLNLEGFASGQTPETSLINLQSLSVKQAAYVGPNEKGGTFDTTLGIQSALKTGVRFFTFQIGYLEVKKDSAKFDDPYVPTLLYRDDNGHLISANGANIGEVVKTLANNAFSSSLPSGTQPLIIYLHFESTPNPLREPEKYVKFLSKVAEFLQPLQEHMLDVSSSGNFKRQQNEAGLLSADISTFESTVLFFSNADTSIFRNLKTLGMDNLDPKYDLDFIVNMRVYLDNASDKLGVTAVPHNGEVPNAVIIPFKTIDALKDDEQDVFAKKGKTRFTIAMPSQMKNPSADSISKALDNCNVNTIALNLFGEPIDDLKKKLKGWGDEPFYKVKGPNYQAVANSL
jgi:hypothetical protein